MTEDRTPSRPQPMSNPAKAGARRPDGRRPDETVATPADPLRPAGGGLAGGAQAGSVAGSAAPGGSWSDSETRPTMTTAAGVEPGPARATPARAAIDPDDHSATTRRASTGRPSASLGGFSLASAGLIVGAILVMLLLGGERRTDGIALTPATTATGAGSGTGGTTTNTRTGTFDDTTNTSPTSTGTAQPSNQ